MNPACCSQKIGTLPRVCTYEKHRPVGEQNTVSVSTQLATLPSSSIPRALNLVPARRQERRESSVKVDGRPEKLVLTGEEAAGTVTVIANPRMAEVRMRDESSADLLFSDSRDRKLTNGWIMNAFHKKPVSKLSKTTVPESAALQYISVCQVLTKVLLSTYLS